MNWQSGTAVNVARVRELILPVIQEVEKNHIYIYSLHHYSTKKDYLYHHAVSVSIISALIGKKIGLQSGQINQLALAGALADCGMAKVSPHILSKDQPLTESEFKEVKLHTANGYKMVKDTPLLKTETKLAIFQHHERFDGTGYPASEKERTYSPLFTDCRDCRRVSCHDIRENVQKQAADLQSIGYDQQRLVW